MNILPSYISSWIVSLLGTGEEPDPGTLKLKFICILPERLPEWIGAALLRTHRIYRAANLNRIKKTAQILALHHPLLERQSSSCSPDVQSGEMIQVHLFRIGKDFDFFPCDPNMPG